MTFNDSIIAEKMQDIGKTAKLVEEVNELVKDLAGMANDQGEDINNIEEMVGSSNASAAQGMEGNLEFAEGSKGNDWKPGYFVYDAATNTIHERPLGSTCSVGRRSWVIGSFLNVPERTGFSAWKRKFRFDVHAAEPVAVLRFSAANAPAKQDWLCSLGGPRSQPALSSAAEALASVNLQFASMVRDVADNRAEVCSLVQDEQAASVSAAAAAVTAASGSAAAAASASAAAAAITAASGGAGAAAALAAAGGGGAQGELTATSVAVEAVAAVESAAARAAAHAAAAKAKAVQAKAAVAAAAPPTAPAATAADAETDEAAAATALPPVEPSLPPIAGWLGLAQAMCLVLLPIGLVLRFTDGFAPFFEEQPKVGLCIFVCCGVLAIKRADPFLHSLAFHLLWNGKDGQAYSCIGCGPTKYDGAKKPMDIFAAARHGKVSFSHFRNDGRWTRPHTKGNSDCLLRLAELLDTVLTVAIAKSKSSAVKEAARAKAVRLRLLPRLAELCIAKTWTDPETKHTWTWCRDWVLRCLSVPLFECLLSEGLLPCDALSDPNHLSTAMVGALRDAAGWSVATQNGTGVSGAKYVGAQSLALCATLGGRADLLGVLCRHGATVAGPVPAEALIAHPKPNEHYMMAGKGACPVALAARVVDTFAGNNGANEMQGAITHGVPR
jgi:hypothetical protein